MSSDPLSSLSSVLDRIDAQKKPRLGPATALTQPLAIPLATINTVTSTTNATKSTSENAKVIDASNPADVWYEFLDASSGKRYYHNYLSQQTSWEKPKSFVAYVVPPPATHALPSSIPLTSALASGADYRAVGYFNQNNGKYTGNTSYWDQVGRPSDKAGRQLAAFVDLEELERNRQETKVRKAELHAQTKGTDWKKVKEDKKKRKLQEWLKDD